MRSETRSLTTRSDLGISSLAATYCGGAVLVTAAVSRTMLLVNDGQLPAFDAVHARRNLVHPWCRTASAR